MIKINVEIRYTGEYRDRGLKSLVYGDSGVGKTKLIHTLPSPITISAEEGLLSIADENLPFIEITSIKQLIDTHKWLTGSEEAKQFESVAIDSISDLAEVLLAEYKPKFKDARQAYGKMNDDLAKVIRKYRGLQDYHVYFIAQMLRREDESTGFVDFIPSLPGKAMLAKLPYYFDLVSVMRFGKSKDGKKYRYLMSEGDMQYKAKDRSGKLDKEEEPDFGVIINKIQKGD